MGNEPPRPGKRPRGRPGGKLARTKVWWDFEEEYYRKKRERALRCMYCKFLLGEVTTGGLWDADGNVELIPPGVILTKELLKTIPTPLLGHIPIDFEKSFAMTARASKMVASRRKRALRGEDE